jgi:hypothetical protein
MKVHIVANGSVQLVISPEDKMEEEFLKKLMKQQNEVVITHSAHVILGKNLNVGSLIFGPKQSGYANSLSSDTSETNAAEKERV